MEGGKIGLILCQFLTFGTPKKPDTVLRPRPESFDQLKNSVIKPQLMEKLFEIRPKYNGQFSGTEREGVRKYQHLCDVMYG